MSGITSTLLPHLASGENEEDVLISVEHPQPNVDVDVDDFSNNSNSKQSRDNCHRFMTICNTVLLVAILAVVVGFVLYLKAELLPKVDNMNATTDKFSHTLTRVNHLIDQIEQIPQVDWDFITNPVYQNKLIAILQEILKYWPSGFSAKLFPIDELPPGMP